MIDYGHERAVQKNRVRRRGIYLLPNLFTTAALFAGFYAIVPTLYPTLARSTGFGIVIGIGRFGGIMAPILGGIAFDAGWGMGLAFTVFALPMLVAAAGVLTLHIGLKRSSRRSAAAERLIAAP